MAYTTPAFIREEVVKPAIELVIPTAHAQELPELTIEGHISKIAQEFMISSTTLYNMAKSEGGLQADPPGYNDNGLACGVVQVHADKWGFDCQELKDHPEIGLRFAAEHIKNDTAWKYWTSCNCVLLLKAHFGAALPKMAQIIPNGDGAVGSVAIFYYRDNETGAWVKHVALVIAVHSGGFEILESNKEPCKIDKRIVAWDDPHLFGFWNSWDM